jgi:hypothetical protein
MRRDRKYLVSTEVDKLMAAVKSSRTVVRDRCLLLLMFRPLLLEPRNGSYPIGANLSV